MKHLRHHLICNILFCVVASVAMIGCGGEDEATPEEVPQLAEEAPVDEQKEATEEAGEERRDERGDSACRGEPVSGCEDVELELCESVGCKIRVFEEQDYAMCFGEVPSACSELVTESQCAQIRGCEWFE